MGYLVKSGEVPIHGGNCRCVFDGQGDQHGVWYEITCCVSSLADRPQNLQVPRSGRQWEVAGLSVKRVEIVERLVQRCRNWKYSAVSRQAQE